MNKFFSLLLKNLTNQKQINQFSLSQEALLQKNQINDMIT